MIVANIEHERLVIDNQEDAEALLRILSKARKVDYTWGTIDGKMQRYFFDARDSSISVEFTTVPLVSYERHVEIKAADAAAEAAKQAATVTDIKAA